MVVPRVRPELDVGLTLPGPVVLQSRYLDGHPCPWGVLQAQWGPSIEEQHLVSAVYHSQRLVRD